MTVIGLFILASCLLATLWASRIPLLDAALILFAGAAITDVVVSISNGIDHLVENIHGMAEGQASQGARQQGRNDSRSTWEQTQGVKDPDEQDN